MNEPLWKQVELQVRTAAEAAARYAREYVIQHAHTLVQRGDVVQPTEAVFRAWWDALRLREGLEWSRVDSHVVSLEGRTIRIDLTVWTTLLAAAGGAAVSTAAPRVAIFFKDRSPDTPESLAPLFADGWLVQVVYADDLARRPEETVREVMVAVRLGCRSGPCIGVTSPRPRSKARARTAPFVLRARVSSATPTASTNFRMRLRRPSGF